MVQGFSPRIVCITGATAGFGLALARRIARDLPDARLVLTGRRRDRLDALKDEFGARALPLALDMRDRVAIETSAAALPDEFRAIDVLVNNAGLALGLGPFHESDSDQSDQMIETNIKGLVHMTRAVLPGMVERKRGHVVNLGSVAGTYPYPGGHVYGGTKAFVEQFSLALRADLLGTRVRVTNIEPGMAETEFSLVRFAGDEGKAAAVYRGVDPMTADDIAEAIFWAITLPARVNINRIELMPVNQATGPFALARD